MFLSSSSPRRSCCCRYCYSKQKFSFVADELDEVVVVVVVVVKVDSSFEENLLLPAVVPNERVIKTTTTSKKNHSSSLSFNLSSARVFVLLCVCTLSEKKRYKKREYLKRAVLSLFFSFLVLFFVPLRKKIFLH